jgi:predicted dehydrogenase
MATSKSIGIAGVGPRAEDFIDILHDWGCTIACTDPEDAALSDLPESSELIREDSFEDLCSLPLDGAILTTPNRFHEAPAKRLLERDIDVLIEKPIAHSLESARSIREASSRSEADCYVAFRGRCSKAIDQVKPLLDAGDFGDIYHVDATYVRTRGIPAIGSWMTSSDLSGGGALIDVGVHAIDAALYLLGSPELEGAMGTTRQRFTPDRYDREVTEVQQFGEPAHREQSDVADSASGFATFSDESTLSIEAHWASNRPPAHDYWIYGENLGAYVDLTGNEVTIFSQDGDRLTRSKTTVEFPEKGRDKRMLEFFLDEIAERETPLATADDGVQTQRIVHRLQ